MSDVNWPYSQETLADVDRWMTRMSAIDRREATEDLQDDVYGCAMNLAWDHNQSEWRVKGYSGDMTETNAQRLLEAWCVWADEEEE